MQSSVPDQGDPHLQYQGIDTNDPGGNTSFHNHEITKVNDNYESLRPFLGWAPIEAVKNTMEATTRYAREPQQTYLKKHFKSRFPALNVPRRNEPVATDTIYSDTPAIGSGATKAQLFVGRKSLLSDVYAMKSESEFPDMLEEVIRKRGAMDTLVSDRAQVEISKKVVNILRTYCIKDFQSEPEHQHQNYAERRWQTIKQYVNTIMDRTVSPEL